MSKKDPLEELRNRLQQESAEADQLLLAALRQESTDEEAQSEWDQLRGVTPGRRRSGRPFWQGWVDVWAALRSRRGVQAAAGLLALLVLGLWMQAMFFQRTETLAMSLPSLKGGVTAEAGRFVNAKVNISVNWRKQTVVIPLKAGGRLTGRFQPAQPGSISPVVPLVFDVSATGDTDGQALTASGQLVIMPKDPDSHEKKLTAKAMLWARLNLKLQAGGKEEPLYRVFGTP